MWRPESLLVCQKDSCRGKRTQEKTWSEVSDTWAPLSLRRKWLPGRNGAAELDPGAPAGAEEGWIGRFKFVKEENDVQP